MVQPEYISASVNTLDAGQPFYSCSWSSYERHNVLIYWYFLLVVYSTAVSLRPYRSFTVVLPHCLWEATLIVFCVCTCRHVQEQEKKPSDSANTNWTDHTPACTQAHVVNTHTHTHTWATLDSVGGGELARFHLFKLCGNMQQGGGGCAV